MDNSERERQIEGERERERQIERERERERVEREGERACGSYWHHNQAILPIYPQTWQSDGVIE